MATQGQKGPKHPQFIGASHAQGTEMETREVSLPVETWEKLDKLSENTVSGNKKTSQINLEYVLNYYLKLCEISNEYSHGMLIDTAAEHKTSKD